MAQLPFRKRERKQRRRKKNRMIPQRLLQLEADQAVPSLADPVAGTPVLTKERALAGFYFITFFYLTLPYFIIFFKCHRGRRPQQGCRALVPGPCWHVPPGMAGTWSGPGAGVTRHPPDGPDGAGREGAGAVPLTGGEPRAWLLSPLPPQGHPPPTHGRSPQHAGSLLSLPGPAAPGTGCSRSAALPRLTSRLCGEPRPALQTAAEVPLVLAQGHVAPRETASPGSAAGMEPLARVSSPVPSKTPNWNCKIVCAYLPPACLPLCCLPLPNAI